MPSNRNPPPTLNRTSGRLSFENPFRTPTTNTNTNTPASAIIIFKLSLLSLLAIVMTITHPKYFNAAMKPNCASYPNADAMNAFTAAKASSIVSA